MRGLNISTPQLFSVEWFKLSYPEKAKSNKPINNDVYSFANWYNDNPKFMPWYCGNTPSINGVDLTIPVNTVTAHEIPTQGVSQAQAIANIKAALDDNKPVVMTIYLPGGGWEDFFKWWDNSPENVAYADIDKFNGYRFRMPVSSHSVCIIGYNDTRETWVILNSWGTTPGRLHGLFELPQNMCYGSTITYGQTPIRQYEFDILKVNWLAAMITHPAPNTTVTPESSVFFSALKNQSSTILYTWDFGDGTSLSDPHRPDTTHIFHKPGSYKVTLKVNNILGGETSDSRVLIVQPYLRQHPFSYSHPLQKKGALDEWIWGLTTDDPTVKTSQQINSLKSFSTRMTLRTVFDPGMTADYYLSSVKSLSNVSDIMGLLVDSYDMKTIDLEDIKNRAEDFISTLNPYVKIWEIGNEVNGDWLGDGVIEKIEAVYDYARNSGKSTALTLFYNAEDSSQMVEWVDENLPVGHRMRGGLDYVFVSYYEQSNNNHKLTQEEVNLIFNQLAVRFPNSKLGFGECGWTGTQKVSDANRIAFYKRFYALRCPEVPFFVGGYFFWNFRQKMVPKTTVDWKTLNNMIKKGANTY
jgi:PKD repeat protein